MYMCGPQVDFMCFLYQPPASAVFFGTCVFNPGAKLASQQASEFLVFLPAPKLGELQIHTALPGLTFFEGIRIQILGHLLSSKLKNILIILIP